MALLQQHMVPCGNKVLHYCLQNSFELAPRALSEGSLLQSWNASSTFTTAAGVAQAVLHSSIPSVRCSSSNTSSRLCLSRSFYSSSRSHSAAPQLHGTTVLCIRKDGEVVLMADGQITTGQKVVKPNAKKLRRLALEPQPSLGGFAGSTADGLTLFERLEQKLEEHPGQVGMALGVCRPAGQAA
eukprot:GHUV01025700.1.p1 GENE.GHUV01025700.1~~GHUV01025700.1.p1  ORF type:complete len:184 (+),score=49.27 GHUV01025700.1:254-805(+)